VFFGEYRHLVGADLLAVSPLAAMRSAPVTMARTFPDFRKWPTMLSVMSVKGIPPRWSSQAVRRAPGD